MTMSAMGRKRTSHCLVGSPNSKKIARRRKRSYTKSEAQIVFPSPPPDRAGIGLLGVGDGVGREANWFWLGPAETLYLCPDIIRCRSLYDG